MVISTEINSYSKYGDVKSVLKLLKDAGFTAYDFSMFAKKWLGVSDFLASDDYLEKAKELRAYADSIGLPCNQAHAPFPTVITDDISHEGISCEEYNERMHVYVERAIEVAGILGAKVVVVHPWNYYTAEQNAALYKSFEKTARSSGVKIGVENMWNWKSGDSTASPAACSHHDDFRKHLDLLPKDVFVACLDIGHAEMAGLETSAVKMIETLSERLEAIHLHDNNLIRDNHAIPFTYNINYAAIIDAMKKVNYQGDITLEADTFALNAPVELMPAVAKYAASVAEYFKNQIEK